MLLISQHELELSLRSTIQRVLVLCAVTFLGIALYAVIAAAFRQAFGLHDQHYYINDFLNLRALIESPLTVAKQTFHSLFDVYTGRAAVYSTDSVTFPFIILSGLAAIAFWSSSSLSQRLLQLALAACILCIPFAQHLLNNGNMPLRTLMAIPPVFWLFAMVGMTSRVRTVAFTAFLATTLGLVQIVYATNMYYGAAYFARIHDQQLAAALYSRIAEAHPDFDSQKTYAVDFFGGYPLDYELSAPVFLHVRVFVFRVGRRKRRAYPRLHALDRLHESQRGDAKAAPARLGCIRADAPVAGPRLGACARRYHPHQTRTHSRLAIQFTLKLNACREFANAAAAVTVSLLRFAAVPVDCQWRKKWNLHEHDIPPRILSRYRYWLPA